MDDKPKIVKLAPKEDEVYSDPCFKILMDYFHDAAKKYGCKELQIVMIDSDDDIYIDGTEERTYPMLGALTKLKSRYERDLDEESEEM